MSESSARSTSEGIYYEKKECRICGSRNLVKYFDFGNMPLANSFAKSEADEEIKVPLEVMYCNDCSNSQLSVVVDPRYLFSNYLYQSAISDTFKRHCKGLADYSRSLFDSKKKLKCLDIGSNDGTLLEEFKSKGCEVIGVDPAENICRKANSNGIRTICSLWGNDAVKQVLKACGSVDIITAINVFAHIDNIHESVSAVCNVMADDGIFIIEFPYMRHLIMNKEFDTIYHEHLSYLLVSPLIKLFSMHDMHICNISEFDIHGGSLRISVAKDSNKKIKINKKSIDHYPTIESREKLNTPLPYRKLAEEAETIKKVFLDKLKELTAEGKSVAAYGASAKGNIFLNFCRLGKDDIKFIVDDTKEKQGLLYSGTKIPIVSREEMMAKKPDYILILAWNFAEEIMKKTSYYRKQGGKYIIAIPKLRII